MEVIIQSGKIETRTAAIIIANTIIVDPAHWMNRSSGYFQKSDLIETAAVRISATHPVVTASQLIS